MSLKKHSPPVREPLIEALAQSPMLQFLGKSERRGQELREMFEHGEFQHFAAGETIFTQGEESDALYVLASGAIRVLIDGGEVCIMDQPGEVFGEFGALTGELRSATIVASEDATCFAISARFTERMALDGGGVFHQLLQQAFIKILLGRLRQSNEEVVGLRKSLRQAENQVAMLRMDNDTLNLQLDKAREEKHEETFHRPRGKGEA